MKECILCRWKKGNKNTKGKEEGENHMWLQLAKFTTIFKMVL